MPQLLEEDSHSSDAPPGGIGRDANLSSSTFPTTSSIARRRPIGKRALTALGIGRTDAVVEKDHQDRDKSRDGHQRHDGSSASSRSHSRGQRQASNDTKAQLVQSAKSALVAGAGEAFRSRKEPEGVKKRRVLTAAVSAGAINVLLNSEKQDEPIGGKRKIAQSVVGGLAVNYLVHGSRHKDGSHADGREDSNDKDREGRDGKSQTDRGVVTAAGTASVNGYKSRDGSRRNSSSEYDSVGEKEKGGKSISSLARAGMAKLGLGKDKNGDDSNSRPEKE